jgi:outer membrane protein assembly factor BamB
MEEVRMEACAARVLTGMPSTKSREMIGCHRWIAQLLLISITCATPIASSAEDWPGWMGPRRDNVLRDFDGLKDFQSPSPITVWRTPIAGGYAGPAVADGRVWVMDYVKSEEAGSSQSTPGQSTGVERVQCLDASNGQLIWKHDYPVRYTVDYPAGPRCTPGVDGDRVYTLGTEGDLKCFEAATGEVVWSRNLPEEFATKTATWGYASHPLIDGDKLICVVGGSGSHTVAFNKHTGQEIWRSGTAREQGYVPPTLIQAGGTRQLISARADAVVSLDPETGVEHWRFDYDASYGSIIMSPSLIRSGDSSYLLVGGFNNKNLLLKLDADRPTAEWLWQDERGKGISPVNVQPAVVDDVLYGFDQGGELMAVQIPSGDRLWVTSQPLSDRAQNSATGFLVRLGTSNRFLMMAETGELMIVQLDRQGMQVLDRVKLIEPTGTANGRKIVWSPPAYAGDSIYLRNDREIIRVKLR